MTTSLPTLAHADLNRGLRWALACAALWLCGTAVAAEQQPVEIRFGAVAGGEAFACGRTYADVGITHSQVTPTDFRFYVSEITLVRADGTAVPVALDQDGLWQYRDVALLDFEDGTGPCRNGTPAQNRRLRGMVPEGQYRGLEFTLGIPFELNHGDATVAPSPLNVTAMFWVWNLGYKFLKLDLSTAGQPDKSLDPKARRADRERAVGFPVHIGSTGCAPGSKTQPPAACKAPNRVLIKLPGFDPSQDTVIVDVAALLSHVDVDWNTPDTAPGCMSEPNDPDCKPVFAAIGLGTTGQKVFRVEAGSQP